MEQVGVMELLSLGAASGAVAAGAMIWWGLRRMVAEIERRVDGRMQEIEEAIGRKMDKTDCETAQALLRQQDHAQDAVLKEIKDQFKQYRQENSEQHQMIIEMLRQRLGGAK